MLDCVDDRASAWTWRAVEELRVDREVTRLGERDTDWAELLSYV